MNKLFIFGIDALDYDLLLRYLDDLPNFKKLAKKGQLLRNTSIFPPDSDTVWSTIYTGLSPAEHGIVNFVDPLRKSTDYLTTETDNKILKGKTFWDVASRMGKKVVVLFPHVCFPPWEVNGIMMSRSSLEDQIQIISKENSFDFNLDKLNTIKGFPSGKKELTKFVKKHYNLIKDEQEFALKVMDKSEWDLFFIYSSSLDVVKHFVWKYCDENDPSYPGKTELKDTIRNLYIKYDKILGIYLEELPKDCSIIVLSDHGHGGRPLKLFNINEFLRQNGYLYTIDSKSHRDILVAEKLKRSALHIIGKYELGKYASKLLKVFPFIRKAYTSPLLVDWDKTIAYISDLSGIKSYSYGGIIINQQKVDHLQYEEIRNKIILSLSALNEPGSENKLFEFVKKREELYNGDFISKYPDIVFNLNNDFGAGWEANGNLFSTSSTHNIVPGSHKANSAVLLSLNVDKLVTENNYMLRIKDIVLNCMMG